MAKNSPWKMELDDSNYRNTYGPPRGRAAWIFYFPAQPRDGEWWGGLGENGGFRLETGECDFRKAMKYARRESESRRLPKVELSTPKNNDVF